MVPPSVAGWRQPRGSGPRRWVPGSEGAGWHLGPSGPGMERGHQESTGDWALRESPPDAPPPPQRSWRHQVTGWPGGGLRRSDSGGMVDKTDGTGRKGRPPPRGRGCRGTVPAPTRPWDLAVERTAEGGPGPNRRVGRRKGRGAGCLPGCGNRTIPAPGQQNARGTNEMETRTAEGMTWPASHCPLLGRVVPSATDVSSVAKERIGGGGERGGREEKELCEPPVL